MTTNTRREPAEIAFKGGRLLMTPGIRDLITAGALNAEELLQRHFLGDDGDICPHDHKANREAIQHGGRIVSSYETPAATVWIITEADRSATTLLLTYEY